MPKTLRLAAAHCALAMAILSCASIADAYFGEIVHTISRGPESNRWWGGICYKDGYLYEILTRCSYFRKRNPKTGETVGTLDFDVPWDEPYGSGLSWDSKRNCWWIVDGKEAICQVPAGGGAVTSYFTSPHRSGVCYDPKIDRLWVTNQVNNRIYRYTADGEREATISVEVPGAGGIVRVGDKFWVTITNTDDGDWPTVYELNLDGSKTGRYFFLPHEDGYFWCIGDLTFDGKYLWVLGGPGNDIYQVDIGYGSDPDPDPTPPPVSSDLEIIDYDGDGRSEPAVYRPAEGLWAIYGLTRLRFGDPADVPVPADYDGDGKANPAVFRPQTGLWRIHPKGKAYFGQAGDDPCPGDFNGDGRADAAIFRDDTGLWAVLGGTRLRFGRKGDMPVYADFNMDGVSDIGIFRPSTGLWAIRGITRTYYGKAGDYPVPGDYLGRGRLQVAVYRPSEGVWAIRGYGAIDFGDKYCCPQAGDFAGNGRHNLVGFWDEFNGIWEGQNLGLVSFGEEGDLPVAARIYKTY